MITVVIEIAATEIIGRTTVTAVEATVITAIRPLEIVATRMVCRLDQTMQADGKAMTRNDRNTIAALLMDMKGPMETRRPISKRIAMALHKAITRDSDVMVVIDAGTMVDGFRGKPGKSQVTANLVDCRKKDAAS